MDKVLNLYKVPEQDRITGVLAVLDSSSSVLPTPENIGDLIIWNDGVFGYRLWQVAEINGELDWIDVPFDTNVYYRDMSSYELKLYFYDQGGATIFEYNALFPSSDFYARLVSFNYGASRMGGAPTISGTVMHRTCLDELWTDRVCVYFNKTFHFVDKIPTSEYSNADERYKHSVEFVSERILLEKVYFMNVVDADNANTDVPVSQWLNFTVSDTISDFVGRLNESLEYSGLQDIGFRVVVDTDQYTTDFINAIEEKYKLLTISETTLKEALDLIYSNWEVPYWFDGYTIHVGFSNRAIMPEGIEMPTFQYGSTDSLLSIQKSQSNDIINRITGFGSSDNLPHFYPNKNPIGGVLRYMRNQTLMVDYARIANPYRLAGIDITDDVHGDTPNGTYFKYMPITKTYNYDQFVSINPQSEPKIVNTGDAPSLVLTPVEDYYIQSRYFVQEYGGTPAIIGHSNAHPEYNIVCKRIWVWLHEGSIVNLTLKDEMNADEMFKKGGASQIIFSDTQPPRFFIKAKSYNYTREQYEAVVNSSQGFSPSMPANLIDKYFNLRTEGSGVVYVWNDGTETDTYNEVFPIELENLPSNATCLSFTVGIMSKYNSATAPTSYVQTQLKTATETFITHTLLSEPDWSKNADGHSVNLYRYYGIKINSNITPQNGDVIYFERDGEYLPSSSSLMPYHFRETGDIWLNALNEEYHKEGSQSEYYVFDNLYKTTFAREGVSNHEDIKPTIKGMSNNSIPSRRIDRIRAVAFDQDDNNDISADGTTPQHPYFYVKLAKTSLYHGYGFNLFDCAIDGATMQLSFTSGKCSGCKFEVMVNYGSDGMARNPIALFTEPTTINGITYPAGTPKRDSDGNVMVNQYQAEQQDTSAQEVWIALKKDTETFSSGYSGSDIPNSSAVYPDLSRVKIPTTSDDFVLLNINLPYAYVVAAEKKLYYALLDNLQEQNKRVFGFSIKFSSIYYKKNYEFMDRWLNESSLVPFIYDGNELEYYVQSYAYKVTDGKLPEVTIELQEKLRRVVLPSYPLYPTPLYPTIFNPYLSSPFTQNATEKMIRRIVNETLEAKDRGVHSAEFNDVQIHGDITMQDGTSLNSQIVAINSQIFANEKIRTKEFAWGEVSKRAEIENLFVDGVFATDYNEYDTTKVRIISGGQGAVGNSCINAVFEDSVSYFSFKQKLAVEELATYTFSFYVKSSNGSSVDVTITQYDGQGNVLDSTVVNVGLGQNWEQKAVSFDTLQDAEYVIAKIANGGEETAVSVYIDGVSLYADNYTAFDQNGNPVINSMMPAKYKMSTADIFNAIDKLGGGGTSSDEVLVCTYENGTVDKTPQEIYDAYQSGKNVVLYYGNGVFYLTGANYSNNAYVIFFETVLNASSSTPQLGYVHYIKGTWRYSTTNLQRQLIDSGGGQNIKTINNQSILGSGDIDTKEMLICTFTGSTTTTCDKTVAQMYDAWYSDKEVIGTLSTSYYRLGYITNTGIAMFFSIRSYDGVTIDKIISTDGGTTWTKSSLTTQEKLTSGTNIKTINGNSVLGRGNLVLNTIEEIAMALSITSSIKTITYGSNRALIFKIQDGLSSVSVTLNQTVYFTPYRVIFDNSENQSDVYLTFSIKFNDAQLDKEIIAPALKTSGGYLLKSGDAMEVEHITWSVNSQKTGLLGLVFGSV